MNINKPIIELEGVSFRYGEESVLRDLSCKIMSGDYVALVGHNGSGKTTLLKVILGILKPDTGKVKLFGVSQESFRSWYKIGYVPQNPQISSAQIPILVREVVEMDAKDKVEVDNALSAVGMLPYKDSLLRELSGGQQQRVFIARALVKKPKLIILDEPTVGVDTNTQEIFYGLLERLNKENGITLILVTHDLHTVSHKAKIIIQLDQTLKEYLVAPCNVIHKHDNYAHNS